MGRFNLNETSYKMLRLHLCVFVIEQVSHVTVWLRRQAVAEINKYVWQRGYNAWEQEAINMALPDQQGAGN